MTTSTEPVVAANRRRMAVLLMSALAAPAAAAETTPPPRTIPIVSLGAAATAEQDTTAPTRTIPLLLGVTAPVAGPAGGGRIDLGAALPAADADAAADPAAPAPRIASLWPLDGSRASGREVTLSGEAASLEFALVAPPGAAVREIAVAAVSSAFISPRDSVMRVFVDGELIGEQPLTSITGLETLRFAAPDGLIRPGVNRVRVEVRLAHRLYCGAQASYDLWTKIALAGSGGVLAPAQTAAGPLAFLAAAGVARGQGLPIVITSVGGQDAPTPGQIREISRQVGRVMGGGVRFSTEAPDAGAGPTGPVIVLRRSGAIEPTFRSGPDGAQTIEVRANGDTLPPLFDGAANVEMSPPLPVLRTDTPVPLSDLGFSTAGISGHLWLRSVGFRLPDDWLIDVNKRAVLRLDFAHVGGMPAGSELRARVNGAVVRLIPLDRAARVDAAPLEIRFNAAILRAGRNDLALEVSVPGDPADQPCFRSEVVRVEIRDDSTLTVPSSPRMRLPGLAAWLSGGGGLSVETTDALAPQTERLAALHELTTALGAADDSGEGPQRRLFMVRGDGLASAPLGGFGVSRSVLLAAIQPPRATGAGSSTDAGAAPQLEVVKAGFLGLRTADLEAGAIDALKRLRRLVLPDAATELADWLKGARGQALLIQLDPATPDDAYVVLSDDADPTAVARSIAAAGLRGAPLDGHVALLDREGTWTTWRDPTRLPVLEEALGQENWRGVLGNFASARPRIFVGALLAIALLSVLIANSYIGASRRAR